MHRAAPEETRGWYFLSFHGLTHLGQKRGKRRRWCGDNVYCQQFISHQ